MPYIPTNLYPKNCAISQNLDTNLYDIDFLAKLDPNDDIIGYTLSLFTYGDNSLVFEVDNNTPTPSSIELDLSEYQEDAMPINEDNEFKLSVRNLNLNTTSYYWTLKIKSKDYDVWITDGETQDGTSGKIVKIFPSQLINQNNQNSYKIFNNNNSDDTFTISSEYYNETTSATNITIDGTSTVITLANSVPVPADIGNMHVTIDTTDYKLTAITSTSVTVSGVHPLTSDTVFGQYINIYRKYMTLITSNKALFSGAGQPFSIYSQAIETPMNYFTIISREITNFEDVENLESSVYGITASYNGKIDWHQFELYRGQELVDKTEKIYSNKLTYQYNNFYTDNAGLPQNYYLKLTVHDTENVDVTKTITISSIYYRQGTSDKLKCSWDAERKAIKLDLTDFVSSEATTYLNNMKVSGAPGNAYIWDDRSLRVLPGGKVEYKQKTEGFVEFPSKSNMLIKLKIGKDKEGDIFSFGNKTFSIKKQDSGTDIFIFDKATKQIYTYTSPNLISENENNKDMIDTQYYLDAITSYPLTSTSTLKFSNVLAENYWYVLISQDAEKSTVEVWLDNNTSYEPKSFEFNSYNNIIDGITLYDDIWCNLIKVSIEEIDTDNPLIWDNGTLFVTKYSEKQLNVSNSQPYPGDSTPYDILIYKKCNLLNEDAQFLQVGSYPFNLKILYDYSVSDEHTYTYYITRLYKNNETNIIQSLPEIISQSVTPDYFEIDVFGTDYEKSTQKDKNIYVLDKNQKWYFELDAIGDDITFNSENAIYSSQEYARVFKTDINYMSGSVSVKLGKLVNEAQYQGDNRHTLDKFKKFAQSTGIKIIRLKDGLIIPVDIQLKQKKNQSNLVGNPTDITFDWFQVGDSETVALVEYEVGE